ncbi:MAG: response regulator [Pseudomonadota bacterium]
MNGIQTQLNDLSEKTLAAPSVGYRAGRSKNVLVVEDHDVAYRAIERHITASGAEQFRVRRASSLAEALALTDAFSFDIALVDDTLADGYGHEFLSAVGGESAPFPTILMSDAPSPPPDLAKKAIEAGAVDYVCKTAITRDFLHRAMGFAIRQFEIRRELYDKIDALQEQSSATTSFLEAALDELHTPMNAVLGFANLASKTTLSANQVSMLTEISSAGEHLAALIGTMHDFVAAPLVEEKGQYVTFSIIRMIGECERQLRVEAGRRGVSLTTYASVSTPNLVRGNPNAMKRIITILGEHGMQCPNVDTISIVSSALSSEFGLRIRIEVRVQADRQYAGQAPTLATREINLSVCQRFIRMLDGDFGVTNIGEGETSYWFEAPISFAAPPQTLSDTQAIEHDRSSVL